MIAFISGFDLHPGSKPSVNATEYDKEGQIMVKYVEQEVVAMAAAAAAKAPAPPSSPAHHSLMCPPV